MILGHQKKQLAYIYDAIKRSCNSNSRILYWWNERARFKNK